jgi:glutamine synthetase
MELMQKIAKKHNMVCLLHEKPFDGVNGSGKHNNWSLTTNTGINLLEPGDTPYENAQFILFLCAVIKAVDEYQDLLRISVATAGNDHRLGAHEAPPAIVSMFLGDELNEILEALEKDADYDAREKEVMRVGVHILPKFNRDTTDRNRTSPFAFTGNKFEFRMLGSAASVSMCNVVINTAVAEILGRFADELENAENFDEALHKLVAKTIKAHKRIIFNGNGYDDAWVKEAEEKGLLNLRTTPDCLPYFIKQKNIDLFTKHKVFSETEMYSRYDIMLENYCKLVNIEALTALDMVKKDILPAVSGYTKELADTALLKREFSANAIYEEDTIRTVSELAAKAYELVGVLEKSCADAEAISDILDRANCYKNSVLVAMLELRENIDKLETVTATGYWPYPSYSELLFSV